MDSLKIFLISTTALPVPPVDYGGIEQVVWDLSYCLNMNGHNVTVACPPDSKLPDGVEHSPTTDSKVSQFNEGPALIKYFKDQRLLDSDIIHDHSHLKLLSNVIKQNENECFFVNTIHCSTSPIIPLLKPNIVALSKDHSMSLYDQYGYKSKVVYNGINLNAYEFNSEKSDYYIFLGRPSAEKGTLTAIKYCMDLDVPIEVVGGTVTGNPNSYNIAVAQHCKLGSKWHYRGAVSHKTKVDFLKNAKALILPFDRNTWREPFGLIVPEALACGTPVITWDVGVFRETIIHGKTGFLANTEKDFKDYMLMVDELDPEDCLRDAKRWSREIMTDRYIDVYRSVLFGERW